VDSEEVLGEDMRRSLSLNSMKLAYHSQSPSYLR
jgi:hypothetical protein